MDRFIRNENLKLYRRQLSETTDDQKRRVLRQLIELLEQDKSFKSGQGQAGLGKARLRRRAI